MYEAFYGMKERPFALTPDPAFLFLSAKHSLALSMLEYSLTGQAGFTVVTGEIGSGKTTLIRQFLKRPDRSINVGVISNTHVGFGDLLQWVLLAFGILSPAGDKASRYQAFASYLIEQYGAGKQTVLVVDEAQNLSIESLEELRLLSNINADKDQLLQMILVGQPELLENLKRPELRQFAQRVSVHYHLSPLSYPETRDYIRHRLKVAGASPNLFDKMAIGAIYYFSNGVPRLINSLCDMSLVYGFAESKRMIDIDTILAVVRDREKGSLLVLPKASGDISRETLIAQTALTIEQDAADVEEEAPEPVVLAEASAPGSAGTPTAQAAAPTSSQAPARAEPAQQTQLNGANGPGAHARAELRAEREAALPPSERKLVMPIMPTYLDEDGGIRSFEGQSRRRPKSRWFRWLL